VQDPGRTRRTGEHNVFHRLSIVHGLRRAYMPDLLAQIP
jgi:hypothetical protein